MTRLRLAGLLSLLAGLTACAPRTETTGAKTQTAAAEAPPTARLVADDHATVSPAIPAAGPLSYTVQDIDGNDVPLEKHRGKVVLIVNVASQCGLTPQYAELQKLHERYAEQGLAILGFPANDFGAQEPGSNAEIKHFCTTNYGVDFDMFAKVSVKGDDQAPLYRYLTSEQSNPQFAGELKWNFTKFLLDREGRVIARFEPRTRPGDTAVTIAIESALVKRG